MIRRTLYEATLVILIALGLALAAYLIRPRVLPLWSAKGTAHPSSEGDQGYRPITMDQAVALFKQKAALFVDARPLEAFEQGHIQGAIHLDPYQSDAWAEALMEEYPLDQTIIAYCEGDQCSLSTDLAEKIARLGFEKVFYLKDGWGQWEKRQLPTAQGR